MIDIIVLKYTNKLARTYFQFVFVSTYNRESTSVWSYYLQLYRSMYSYDVRVDDIIVSKDTFKVFIYTPWKMYSLPKNKYNLYVTSSCQGVRSTCIRQSHRTISIYVYINLVIQPGSTLFNVRSTTVYDHRWRYLRDSSLDVHLQSRAIIDDVAHTIVDVRWMT